MLDIIKLIIAIAQNEHMELFEDIFDELLWSEEIDQEKTILKIQNRMNEKTIGCNYCWLCDYNEECNGG